MVQFKVNSLAELDIVVQEIKKLIDSLYTNTNYFNEVIKECATLYPKKKEKTSNQVEINHLRAQRSQIFLKKTKVLVLILAILISIYRNRKRLGSKN